uniref:Uncharacterized protein n=1 Tax=Onchocerca volvulus TaxID=6282 RepID=A0A8R1XWQ2_ONCVO
MLDRKGAKGAMPLASNAYFNFHRVPGTTVSRTITLGPLMVAACHLKRTCQSNTKNNDISKTRSFLLDFILALNLRSQLD